GCGGAIEATAVVRVAAEAEHVVPGILDLKQEIRVFDGIGEHHAYRQRAGFLRQPVDAAVSDAPILLKAHRGEQVSDPLVARRARSIDVIVGRDEDAYVAPLASIRE